MITLASIPALVSKRFGAADGQTDTSGLASISAVITGGGDRCHHGSVSSGNDPITYVGFLLLGLAGAG